MKSRWRISADMSFHGLYLPGWIGKTLFQCNYMQDQVSHLPYPRWYIDLHTQFHLLSISHGDFPHIISARSFFSSTLTLPENMKLSHCSVSLHAIIKNWHRVEHVQSTALTEYCIHHILHHPEIDCLPVPASLWYRRRICCFYLSTFLQLHVNQYMES
jgi:hypothetical protein